jgi:hypothetical protein
MLACGFSWSIHKESELHHFSTFLFGKNQKILLGGEIAGSSSKSRDTLFQQNQSDLTKLTINAFSSRELLSAAVFGLLEIYSLIIQFTTCCVSCLKGMNAFTSKFTFSGVSEAFSTDLVNFEL